MRTAGTQFRPTFDWRPTMALFLLALIVAGCRGLLVEPAPSVASLNLAVAPAPSVAVDGITDAFDQADNVLVQIIREGKPRIEEVFQFVPAQETRISIRIELDEDEEPATIIVQLRKGAAVLFRAQQSVVLRAGESPGIQLTLTATPDRVVIDGPGTLVAPSVGDTIQLQASVRFATGDEVPRASITWMTTAPNVAAVNSAGRVVIVGPGNAEIRASHGDLVAAVAVQVVQVVRSVTVNPSSVEIELGETSQMTATARDARGNIVSGRPVAWSSSSPDVSVNATGLVTAIGRGEAVITARIDDVTGSSSVHVRPPAPEPSPFAGNWSGYIEDLYYPEYYTSYVYDLSLQQEGSTLSGTLDVSWYWGASGFHSLEQVSVDGDQINFMFVDSDQEGTWLYYFYLTLGSDGHTLSGIMDECYSQSESGCYPYTVSLYRGQGSHYDSADVGADATAGARSDADAAPRPRGVRDRPN